MFALLVAAYVGTYVGHRACQGCHPAEFRTQSVSHHAAALRPADASLAALLGDRPLRERSGVEFTYEGAEVKIVQGTRAIRAPLEWAFGAGVQAITPVGRYGGRYFEHRISWYREAGHGARTIGHAAEPSGSPERALGMMQDAATITRCFQCHATGVEPGPKLDSMVPGVTCERCHGPGAAHAAQPSRANIERPGAALCTTCHRADAPLDDPVSVRFQPVGLMASKCYRASGKLSCLTCHNPHQDLVRDAAYYTARCISCHSEAACSRTGRGACIECHMRRESPLPFLTFTDHRIR